jgi:hypothetical protein
MYCSPFCTIYATVVHVSCIVLFNVTEGHNECDEWVNARWDKGVDGNDDSNAAAHRCVDRKEDKGTAKVAEVGAAARRRKTMK